MRDRFPRITRAYLAALVALPLLSSSLIAQAGLGQLADATTPPRGYLRLRPIVVWTRADSRFTATGVEPLGGNFTADSLGSANFPPLAIPETLTRLVAQTGPAYRLSLGRSRMDATARGEVIPLALDYGITNRLAIGVVVPVIRRRLTTQFQLDSTGANVGPNLNRTSTTALQTNTLVQSEFANAASQLQSRISSCQGDPSGPGCGAVLADGPSLLSQSQAFATAVESLYGSAADSGQAWVPRTTSAEQTSVANRVADFNARYFALLGANIIQAIPVGAAGPPGSAQFQSYVVDDVLGDSLSSQERFGIGDVEVGFKLRVIERLPTQARPFGLLFAVAADVRLPTGSKEAASQVLDLSLSERDPIVDGRAIVDAMVHRFGLISSLFVSSRLPRSSADADPLQLVRDGTWLEFNARPRWHFSAALSVDGAYSLVQGDVSSRQWVGGGVTYSNFFSRPKGSAPSVEARFTHLEAITGEAGMPKEFREQIELRIYFRPFR